MPRARPKPPHSTAAEPLADYRGLTGKVDAVIVAAPTTAMRKLVAGCSRRASTSWWKSRSRRTCAGAARLVEAAARQGRILQAGHLERFNPAVAELERRISLPLFFEIHRMNQFSPRSLDVDVVLDLMIHDVDIVLALAGAEPQEIRAGGISILSPKVDIANVRLQFPNGCVANLTASRISTEKVRKLRLFQPHQYLSLDYSRQDLASFRWARAADRVRAGPRGEGRAAEAATGSLSRKRDDAGFGEIFRTRGASNLRVALSILDKIKEHSEIVSRSLVAGWKP